jgi:hydrogenase nickel incorporation protein HypA/HybF
VIGVAGDRPVTRVRVSIGALQRVVPDSLEFGFRLVAEGTVCESARREVAHIPVRVRCTACGVESCTDEEPVGCPACGAGAIEMLGGAEVLLDEVELAGTPPTVIRRAGMEVVEPPHEHDHEHVQPSAQQGGGRGESPRAGDGG